MRVQNEQELGNAVKQEESCIELEGKLASQIKKLMKLNMALWVFSLTALSIAVLATIQAPATAGVQMPGVYRGENARKLKITENEKYTL